MTQTETHSRVMQVLALAKDMDASEAKQSLRILNARLNEVIAGEEFRRLAGEAKFEERKQARRDAP